MDELTRLLEENFEYLMTNVHTAFPGVVVKYDSDTRRADIQPSIKRKLPSGEFVDFPVIPDVPVLFPGTKKYTVCYPLEKDDEVLCICMERGTDSWRDAGGSGIEESDPRRFSLMDCMAVPGLQAVDFIAAEGDGFCIVHKSGTDGDLISSVVMDDEKIELRQKEAVLTVSGNKMSFKNGKKDFYTVMSKILDDCATHAENCAKHKTVGSPANHQVSPDDIQKFTTDQTNFQQDKSDLGEVMEEGE